MSEFRDRLAEALAPKVAEMMACGHCDGSCGDCVSEAQDLADALIASGAVADPAEVEALADEWACPTCHPPATCVYCRGGSLSRATVSEALRAAAEGKGGE